MQTETETKEKPAEKMVDAEHAPVKQMDMKIHQERSLESEAAFTTNTNSTSIQTRSPLKSHPLFNNYDLWKRKLRENCFKRVRDDRKRLLWKMRMLPPSQPLNLDSKDLMKYDFHGIVSDELKNLKESSLSYSSNISNSAPCSDDLLWDYNGLHDTYQGECEEMMLEMQRIFYEDLRAELTRQEPESYIETWQDDEDEYLARAVYEHMQLNEKQLHEVIWCPICREGQLREDHHFICCTLCELKLNKGDEVNLELLRDRLVEVCAEHLDSGCVLKPNFCLETRFHIAAIYILCNGCNTFEVVI